MLQQEKVDAGTHLAQIWCWEDKADHMMASGFTVTYREWLSAESAWGGDGVGGLKGEERT